MVIVRGAKIWGVIVLGGISWGALVQEELVRGNCQGGKSPGDYCPWGNFMGGQFPGRQLSKGGEGNVRIPIITLNRFL